MACPSPPCSAKCLAKRRAPLFDPSCASPAYLLKLGLPAFDLRKAIARLNVAALMLLTEHQAGLGLTTERATPQGGHRLPDTSPRSAASEMQIGQKPKATIQQAQRNRSSQRRGLPASMVRCAGPQVKLSDHLTSFKASAAYEARGHAFQRDSEQNQNGWRRLFELFFAAGRKADHGFCDHDRSYRKRTQENDGMSISITFSPFSFAA